MVLFHRGPRLPTAQRSPVPKTVVLLLVAQGGSAQHWVPRGHILVQVVGWRRG